MNTTSKSGKYTRTPEIIEKFRQKMVEQYACFATKKLKLMGIVKYPNRKM